MDNDFFKKIICCPVCKGGLTASGNGFVCDSCLIKFGRIGNVYNFDFPRHGFSRGWANNLLARKAAGSRWFREIAAKVSAADYQKALLDGRINEIDRYIEDLSAKVDVGKRYDDRYSPQGKPDLHIETILREAAAMPKNAVIIDMGAGTLRIARELAARGHDNIIALDLLPQAMEYGYRCLSEAERKRIVLVKADARFLPFRDNSIDRILALEFFEHIDNPMLVLLDIKRVLASGGQALMNTWSAHELRAQKAIGRDGKSSYRNGFYYAFYLKNELKAMLGVAGLDFNIKPHGFYLHRYASNRIGKKNTKIVAASDRFFAGFMPLFMFKYLLFRCSKNKHA